MESEIVDTDVLLVTLFQNLYDPTGDDAVMKYRHGATPAACVAAAWNTYTVPFISLGYVQIRLEAS